MSVSRQPLADNVANSQHCVRHITSLLSAVSFWITSFVLSGYIYNFYVWVWPYFVFCGFFAINGGLYIYTMGYVCIYVTFVCRWYLILSYFFLFHVPLALTPGYPGQHYYVTKIPYFSITTVLKTNVLSTTIIDQTNDNR